MADVLQQGGCCGPRGPSVVSCAGRFAIVGCMCFGMCACMACVCVYVCCDTSGCSAFLPQQQHQAATGVELVFEKPNDGQHLTGRQAGCCDHCSRAALPRVGTGWQVGTVAVERRGCPITLSCLSQQLCPSCVLCGFVWANSAAGLPVEQLWGDVCGSTAWESP